MKRFLYRKLASTYQCYLAVFEESAEFDKTAFFSRYWKLAGLYLVEPSSIQLLID